MNQTGLILKIKKGDYVLGSSPLVSIPKIDNGEWDEYLPTGELQRQRDFKFDTLSCATFSALNSVEMQLKYLIKNKKLNDEQLDELIELGINLTEPNFSDRFSSIVDGTTKIGNSLQAPWESFRTIGLVAETVLPFDENLNKWEEYINWSVITDKLKQQAKRINEVLQFSYEWVIYDEQEKEEKFKVQKDQLKYAPLHSACNSRPHAVCIYKDKKYFNSYEPYENNKVKSIQFALKGMVDVCDNTKIYTTLKQGDKGLGVKKLQRKLGLKDDGSFGPITKAKVMVFQSKNNLFADGIVGAITRQYLNKI